MKNILFLQNGTIVAARQHRCATACCKHASTQVRLFKLVLDVWGGIGGVDDAGNDVLDGVIGDDNILPCGSEERNIDERENEDDDHEGNEEAEDVDWNTERVAE